VYLNLYISAQVVL